MESVDIGTESGYGHFLFGGRVSISSGSGEVSSRGAKYEAFLGWLYVGTYIESDCILYPLSDGGNRAGNSAVFLYDERKVPRGNTLSVSLCCVVFDGDRPVVGEKLSHLWKPIWVGVSHGID